MLAAALTTIALGWSLLIVATPVAATTGRGTWAAAIAYEIGSLVCHQRPERSFHILGMQMPVCARCFGLYASGTAGLLLAAAGCRYRWSSRTNRLVLAAAAVPIAATVALEWAGAIHTSNALRMVSGLPLGAVAGLVFGGMLRPAG